MRWLVCVPFIVVCTAQPPNSIKVEGPYRNLAGYAYQATVPSGLTGHTDAPPAPNHGFATALDSASGNRIWVDGSYNILGYPTARAAAENSVGWIRTKAETIEGAKFVSLTLAGLQAAEVFVRYPKRSAVRVYRSVAAIRQSRASGATGIVYEIALDTSTEQLAKDRRVFEAVVRSFRLDPLPRGR